MKKNALLFAAALLVGTAGSVFAQDARVAPGTPAPNAPRVESSGAVSPAPSQTVTGGVGATEQVGSGTRPQTKTGGPAGGQTTGGSGGGG